MTPTIAHRFWRLLRKQSGQAVVEFAYVVPILCVLVLTLVEFALGINEQLNATHLASMGARLAAVTSNLSNAPICAAPQPSPPNPGCGGSSPSYSSLQAYILGQASGDLKSATVCVTFPGGTHTVGSAAKVTVRGSFNVVPSFGSANLNIPVKGSSTMRIEAASTVDFTTSNPAGC